jgi:hypothetical protein
MLPPRETTFCDCLDREGIIQTGENDKTTKHSHGMIRDSIFDSIVAKKLSPPAYLQLAATTDVSIRTGERL